MKKIFIIIISLSFSLSVYSQVKYTVTDSTFVGNTKFVLIETEDRIAEIQAFYKGVEEPISGVIKMCPPVYFVRGYGTDELLKNSFFFKNGDEEDVATVFLIVGNMASIFEIEGRGFKITDGFCGKNVQGVILSPYGTELTDFMHLRFTNVKNNSLGMKDLRMFVDDHLKIKKKAEAAKKKKAKKE